MNLLFIVLRFLLGDSYHQKVQFQPLKQQTGRLKPQDANEWTVRFLWLPLLGWITLGAVSGRQPKPVPELQRVWLRQPCCRCQFRLGATLRGLRWCKAVLHRPNRKLLNND